MTGLVTFGTATVPTVRTTINAGPNAREFEVTFECTTGTFSDYTALAAMKAPMSKTTVWNGKTRIYCPAGTSATLTVNGTAYANCYIEELSGAEANNSLPFEQWNFTVKFTQNCWANA